VDDFLARNGNLSLTTHERKTQQQEHRWDSWTGLHSRNHASLVAGNWEQEEAVADVLARDIDMSLATHERQQEHGGWGGWMGPHPRKYHYSGLVAGNWEQEEAADDVLARNGYLSLAAQGGWAQQQEHGGCDPTWTGLHPRKHHYADLVAGNWEQEEVDDVLARDGDPTHER